MRIYHFPCPEENGHTHLFALRNPTLDDLRGEHIRALLLALRPVRATPKYANVRSEESVALGARGRRGRSSGSGCGGRRRGGGGHVDDDGVLRHASCDARDIGVDTGEVGLLVDVADPIPGRVLMVVCEGKKPKSGRPARTVPLAVRSRSGEGGDAK